MNKTSELKIDSTLWATPSKLVNLLNFNPDKISIKTENHANDIKVHYVRYESGGFCLTIDDLDGYFDFSHDLGHLSLLFDDDLPIGDVFKINLITIVIKSLIEKDNIFYPEIALNHCSYEI